MDVKLTKSPVKMTIRQPPFYSLKLYGRPSKGSKIDKRSYENVIFATNILINKTLRKAYLRLKNQQNVL